ncbi:MAG TPA: cytochrome c biogenesis protein DipZ [Mycobacteriales bacterium]|jgi:cytochrome c biogenesis protein CcdA/thiol-disulfide isomerase/thioredoxin|nr:cytochrome c biogenesis protein DipZ [Mycobacteriales bacterium]
MSPLLLLIGFLAGLLTIITPCILPVLPAVIASGVTAGGRKRAFAIATGLALAFGLSALLSIRLLTALGLPLGLRYDLALVVLYLLAVGFLVPKVGLLIERPFARIGLKRAPDSSAGGLLLGASLGLLYLPCAGPIFSAISAVGAQKGSFGFNAVALTIAYSLGIAVPIFGLVILTSRLTKTVAWLRTHAVRVRQAGGVGLLASAVAITFGAATSLQTAIPSYSASIENHLSDSTSIHSDLDHISNPHESAQAKALQNSLRNKPTPTPQPTMEPMADQIPTLNANDLPVYGKAPDFADVTHWFNTPDGAALNLAQLKGKVVLVDFWTYSCINCLRSLPHVEAWYSRYHSDGFEVIGVHTPEFDFEHVEGNVASAISRLGVTYPVAMDNDYGTWNAWGNDSWPAEYLIDPSGNVRYGSVGEGDYGRTEAAIRALLTANGVKNLPSTTDVPDKTPMQASTPESYLGYERLERYDGTKIVKNAPSTYTFASSLAASHLTYSGTWTVSSQDILAGNDAELRINVSAADTYLVLAGDGTVTATLNGKQLPTQQVSGVPTLYTLYSGTQIRKGVLELHVSPGVKAYDFTFG